MGTGIYCDNHDYSIIDTVYACKIEDKDSGSNRYTRVTSYYCKKCLDEKEISKSEVTLKDKCPDWFNWNRS